MARLGRAFPIHPLYNTFKGALTLLTIDSSAWVEVTGGSSRDAVAGVEVLAGQRRDETPRVEVLADITIDDDVLLEISSQVSLFDAVARVELVSGQRRDESLEAEAALNFRRDDVIQMEEGSSFFVRDVSLLAEFLVGRLAGDTAASSRWVDITADVPNGDGSGIQFCVSDQTGLILFASRDISPTFSYFSSNEGITWTGPNTAFAGYVGASSSDGQVLVAGRSAGSFPNFFILSTDGGGTWSASAPPFQQELEIIDLSGDGQKILLGDTDVGSGGTGLASFSLNQGASWTQVTGVPATTEWVAGAVSRDGSTWYLAGDTFLIKSVNDGSSWSDITPGGTSPDFFGVCCSATGSVVFMVEATSKDLYVSLNGGSLWSTVVDPFGGNFVSHLVCSDDGAKVLAAVGNSNIVLLSEDTGSTWVQQSISNVPLDASWVSMSGDGKRASASGDGFLYVLEPGFVPSFAYGYVQAESLSGNRSDTDVPVEIASSVSVYDEVAQIEFSGVVAAIDATAQVEITPSVISDASIVGEVLGGVRDDDPTPLELLGPFLATTGDSGLPLDYSGAVLRDAAVQVEFDGAVSTFDALATIEGLADVARDVAPRDEILSQVDADAPLPVDYQSRVVINAEAVAPFEVLVAVLHDAISQLELESVQLTDAALGDEVLAGVRRDVNVLVESLGNFAVTGDAPALIEIFGHAVTDSGSPPNIEILGAARYDSVANTDWSAYLLVDDRADAEFLVAVNRNAVAQLEIITQQHFASDANAQLEFTVAVSTESTIPTEFISAIVRYDSNTQTEWTALQSLDNQGAANLEFLQSFSAETGVPVEILRTIFLFSGDAGVPLEITFKISTTQQDVGVPLEIMKFARIRRNRNQLYSTLWSGIDDIGGTWN